MAVGGAAGGMFRVKHLKIGFFNVSREPQVAKH